MKPVIRGEQALGYFLISRITYKPRAKALGLFSLMYQLIRSKNGKT